MKRETAPRSAEEAVLREISDTLERLASAVESALAPGAGRDPVCDIVRNGDQYRCRVHMRYWSTGICPGLQPPPGEPSGLYYKP